MLSNFKSTSMAFFRKLRPVISGMGFIILFMFLSIASYAFYDYMKSTEEYEDGDVAYDESSENSDCNIMGLELRGSILTYVPDHAEGDTFFDYDVTASEYISSMIISANEDESIKGIIIEVDSPGGSPVAGEEISVSIKDSEKPVIAFIRDWGVSSAYWSISSADKIFASKNSDVGGIGVTSSFLSNVERNKKEGLTYEELSTGKFKDAGSPDRPLTAEDRAMFMRDLNLVYGNFVEAVSKNRNIPVEKVKSIADGSSVLGQKGKELGLIDEIGGYNEVKKYLEEQIGEKVEVCW